jgi:hypothetical protein
MWCGGGGSPRSLVGYGDGGPSRLLSMVHAGRRQTGASRARSQVARSGGDAVGGVIPIWAQWARRVGYLAVLPLPVGVMRSFMLLVPDCSTRCSGLRPRA